MSHYLVSVLVSKEVPLKGVMERVDQALAPFDEAIEVEPYLQCNEAMIIEETKERFQQIKRNVLAYAYQHSSATSDMEALDWFYTVKPYVQEPRSEQLVYIDEIYDSLESAFYQELTDNDYWAMASDPHHILRNFYTLFLENGELYSTSNPNRKWDWYCPGGRWEDYLTDEVVNNPSFYRKNGFTTLNALKERPSDVSFALLDLEGNWHEPGQMGWFGMSTKTPESQQAYQAKMDQYLETLPPETWICFVDCHI